MTSLLTAAEIKLCQNGFFHCIDNGYGKIESLDQVLKIIGMMAERAKYEAGCAKRDGIVDEAAQEIQGYMISFAKAIEARI